ncbi:uncharacterized protein [Aegilops tauschii subsp. strangulata]|uniref:uncharacterized protein isoform X4 n=1 Tax=Aegilops tauschii subsp. strangulata TaxID=200361 RepID=UPI001ABCF95E|nr:calmodulin-binding protein 60 C isoform X4 [Aegilops tauschii subsp. strangulata]
MAPKRELVLASARGSESAKRLRVGVPGAACAGGSESERSVPASPGKRLLRQTVFVVLFLVRMSEKITVTESMSQIGRMVQKLHKVQTLIMSKLESLQQQMEDISHEVKKLACLHSDRHADQHPRSEPYQEGATLSEQNANIRLRFLDGLKTPVYTDKNITSESDAAIRIGIFNGDNMIKEGLLSKLKIEILVLHGDFCNDCQGNWTGEEFNSQIVQGRDGHRFVLGGDCSVWLNNGEASFGRIRFKEGSSRTRSRKFVVGARVCMGEKTGVRVQEAVMKPVTVLDRRNEANEKRYPPKPNDEVYRLEEIANDGTYHRRLKNAKIYTVEDFLKALNKDADDLRVRVLLIKKVNNSWEKMVKHAKGCCLTDINDRMNVSLPQQVPFDYVMNDNLSSLDAVILEPDETLQANENQLHDRIDHVTEPSHHNEYVHGDQNTVKSNYYQVGRSNPENGNLAEHVPFNYVMNVNPPEQAPSSTHSSLDAVMLKPDEVLQGTAADENRFHQVTEPSHSNEHVHGDQNAVNTHCYQGAPPLGQQQPTTFMAPSQLDGEFLWILEGSVQANIHSQMQVPISMDCGSAMEASTSVQHNLLPQPFVPTQFQESMPGIHYSENPPNHASGPTIWHDDPITEPEPSAYPYPGLDHGNF